MPQLYDTIGVNYAELRRPDPRIAAAIEAALGSAESVLNVGAGTGSYEPTDRQVTAVEPSLEMIAKRKPSSAKIVRAFAGDLPFADKSFDAAMAILTLHHWPDPERGLREMRRVSRGPLVILTYDPKARPWLTDYLPQLIALDEAKMPKLGDYEGWLGKVQISPVLVPHDCSDGFLYAFWKRPKAYLDARIRSGSSAFWAIEGAEAGLAKLAQDLESGEWQRRYGALTSGESYDAGYRLIVAPTA